MKPDSINMSLSQLKYGEVDSQQCLGHEVMKVLHDSQKNLKSFANAITSGTSGICQCQEPITQSLHFPCKPLKSTLSDEKLFIEMVFAQN